MQLPWEHQLGAAAPLQPPRLPLSLCWPSATAHRGGRRQGGVQVSATRRFDCVRECEQFLLWRQPLTVLACSVCLCKLLKRAQGCLGACVWKECQLWTCAGMSAPTGVAPKEEARCLLHKMKRGMSQPLLRAMCCVLCVMNNYTDSLMQAMTDKDFSRLITFVYNVFGPRARLLL